MAEKLCAKCGKPGKFTKNRARKDGLNSNCTECHRQYTQRHYQENKGYYLTKAVRSNAKRDEKFNQIRRDGKNKPCADCGVKYPYYVMDFDHVRGEKVAGIAQMNARKTQVRKLVAEIAKCEVVCANCHRERTHRRSFPSQHHAPVA